MGEFGVGSFTPFHQQRLFSYTGRHDLSRAKLESCVKKTRMKKREWQCHTMSEKKPNSRSEITLKKPSEYTSRISTDIPLHELPGATFDHYLEDKPRVFKAIFPREKSQQLNEEEWRIQMFPVNFLHLTVRPVVHMRLRCKTKGVDYPPQIPQHVTKVLELDTTKWELQGLDSTFNPSQFSLGVKGAMYPDRQGTRSRLKSQLEMSISFLQSPLLTLVPENVLRSVAESLLQSLLKNMKREVNGSLLADYSKFKGERPKEGLDMKGDEYVSLTQSLDLTPKN